MKKREVVIIAIPIVLIGTFILYRERKPSLDLGSNIDWSNKIPTVRFGRNTEALSNESGIVGAGVTYSQRYKLHYKRSGNTMIIEIKNRAGKIIESVTIDFKSKLIY